MTQGLHGSGMLGETCDRCGQTEQRCAYLAGCCQDCTHWADLDDCGNGKHPVSLGQMRPAGAICGTEVGFAWHVQRGTPACYRCRHAYRQAKVQRFLGRTA